VRAALALPGLNGPTEGHINKLKLIKRRTFGRMTRDHPGAPDAACAVV
jgi:transposase